MTFNPALLRFRLYFTLQNTGYLSQKRHKELVSGYEEVGRMLGSMIAALRSSECKKQKAVAS